MRLAQAVKVVVFSLSLPVSLAESGCYITPWLQALPTSFPLYSELFGLEALIAENTRPTAAGGHFCIICAKVLKGDMSKIRSHFVDLHWLEAPAYICPGKKAKMPKGLSIQNCLQASPA